MITIHIHAKEIWDDHNKEFVQVNEQTVNMEHSLISITKWESKYHKTFMDDTVKKTNEELIDYFRCMCITPLKDPRDILGLTSADMDRIVKYMANPMIPFKFKEDPHLNGKHRGGDPMCGIMIYYYMVAAQIPFECQKWHINQLMALIRIYGMKNNPGKPLKGSALANRNTSLNAARRAKLGSKG